MSTYFEVSCISAVRSYVILIRLRGRTRGQEGLQPPETQRN